MYSAPRTTSLALLAALLGASLTGCYFDFTETDANVGPGVIDAQVTPDAFVPLDPNFLFLSETGLYSDTGNQVLADGVLRFEPEFKLWSDDADKERFIWLPPGSQIDTSDMDRWRFPPGTKIWKNFSRPELGMVETRFIMRLGFSPEQTLMTSFVWNEGDTDASRAPLGAAIAVDGVTTCPEFPTTLDPTPNCHFVPREDQCVRCHEGQEHNMLGFQAIQLSWDNPVGIDFADLVAMNLLSAPPAPGVSFPLPGTGLAHEAVGYMHANCGHCHNRDVDYQESCFGLTQFEARAVVANATIESTTAYLSSVNTLVSYWDMTEGNLDPTVNCRIAPGNAAASAVFQRMSHRDGWSRPHKQMPPEFTAMVDVDGVALIEAWINSMTEPAAPTCLP